LRNINFYAGPKPARNILTNLSPNPARPEKLDLQFCSKAFGLGAQGQGFVTEQLERKFFELGTCWKNPTNLFTASCVQNFGS